MGQSSRDSTAGAGWQCPAGRFQDLVPKRAKPFRWLDPRPLWQSRNDRLARAFGDPTNERRQAWMAQLGTRDLVVDVAQAGPFSFLVMGDTGEGDGSQLAVVPPLLVHARDAAFLFICSDVIYPAGGIDDYLPKLFGPYVDFPAPIYAIPGNHDWYDDATGFMHWFCGQAHPPGRPRSRLFSKAWVRDRLWRRAPRAGANVAEVGRLQRPPGQVLRQPGPYFAIDVGELRLVGIDTGITGAIDRDQATWLREVSKGDRPKVLLTGKPIYVDGFHHPGAIEGERGTVDDIVRDPQHHYIAAVGGDIHNYQRYPVRLGDGRTIVYLVSGGGGAFMHDTHGIDKIDATQVGAAVSEADFRCYPLRGDCLSRYSVLYGRKLRLLGGLLSIRPDAAAAIMARRLGLVPTRPRARQVRPTWRERLSAAMLLRLPARGKRGLHLPFSAWLDWNEPPMFKSFLRFDVDDGQLTIRCFAATGCAAQEDDPPVEDTLRARRAEGGRWEWSF